jgi:thioredoxin-related protein
MKPIVHGLDARYTDRIVFTYLDIDDPATRPFKEALRFRYQPHFILLDGSGNVIQQWFGLVREEDFVAAFEDALRQAQ